MFKKIFFPYQSFTICHRIMFGCFIHTLWYAILFQYNMLCFVVPFNYCHKFVHFLLHKTFFFTEHVIRATLNLVDTIMTSRSGLAFLLTQKHSENECSWNCYMQSFVWTLVWNIPSWTPRNLYTPLDLWLPYFCPLHPIHADHV